MRTFKNYVPSHVKPELKSPKKLKLRKQSSSLQKRRNRLEDISDTPIRRPYMHARRSRIPVRPDFASIVQVLTPLAQHDRAAKQLLQSFVAKHGIQVPTAIVCQDFCELNIHEITNKNFKKILSEKIR